MMNRMFESVFSRIKTNQVVLWVFLTLLTVLTIVGPVLAEGATGSSG